MMTNARVELELSSIKIDTATIKNIIKEFAEKYNFIHETDIEIIENSVFNVEKYNKIHNKPFIIINEYKY